MKYLRSFSIKIAKKKILIFFFFHFRQLQLGKQAFARLIIYLSDTVF